MEENKDIKERRKFPRAPVNVEILVYDSPSQLTKGQGVLVFYTLDISVGGLFIETTVPLKIGSTIYLRFQLPGSPRIITTQAKIVRTNDPHTELMQGMAAEFLHLSFEDKQSIDEYVKNV